MIDSFHNGHYGEEEEEEEEEEARIVWIDLLNKRIALSSLPHILSFHPSFIFDLKKDNKRDIVENAIIVRTLRTGLILDLGETAKAFCKVEEEEKKEEEKKKRSFKTGTTVAKCRIVNECLMDGEQIKQTKKERKKERNNFFLRTFSCIDGKRHYRIQIGKKQRKKERKTKKYSASCGRCSQWIDIKRDKSN